MKAVIAVDSFKGSISSEAAGEAVSLGIRDVYPDAEIVSLPLADGGEGTVDALVRAVGGARVRVPVTGPLEEAVDAEYGILDDGVTAVMEVAAACGLPLVPAERRNPLNATTFGVGELIRDALSRGCRSFIIGLGGSATNDAGVGMLQALGFRFLDENGAEVGRGGRALEAIRRIDVSGAFEALAGCTFRVACDVNNPLHGPSGAAFVFGPQKGATPDMVRCLDRGLAVFAKAAAREIGRDVQAIPGAGAAGGLGAAFAGFLNAQLVSGIDLVLETIGLEKHLAAADVAVTGEGRLDEQTAMGKAPAGIARMAARHGIPVIALGGSVTQKTAALHEAGITACFSILHQPMTLEQAMEGRNARDNLRHQTQQLFRLIRALR